MKTTDPKVCFILSRNGLHGVIYTVIKNGRIGLSFDDCTTQDIQRMENNFGKFYSGTFLMVNW